MKLVEPEGPKDVNNRPNGVVPPEQPPPEEDDDDEWKVIFTRYYFCIYVPKVLD